MPKRLAVTLLGMIALGCSHQDFTRPPLHNPFVDLLDSRKPYVKPTKSPAEVRMERFAKALAAQRAEARNGPSDYLLGANDLLSVSILSLEEPGKTTLVETAVSEEGSITLPWIGKVAAKGLSVHELEERIAAAYGRQYILDPQVTVAVKDYRSVEVTVTGAVEKPGVFYLQHNTGTVLEMLALAGGPKEEAGDTLLVIHAPSDEAKSPSQAIGTPAGPKAAPGNAATVALKELIDSGDLRLNLTVGNGDIVSVPPRPKAYVYVLGYVQRPGAYELKDGMRVDALRLVAIGGGLSPTARASNSLLVRETGKGQESIPVDLIKIAKGVRPPVFLEPGDTLVVGSSMDARFSEYFRSRASIGATAGF